MPRYLLAAMEGIEDVVAADALDLGARTATPTRGRVLVEAEDGWEMRANLAHPTTTRVLRVLHEGRIESLADVELLVREVDWPALFSHEQSFAGDSVRTGEHAFTSLDVARAAGDGVIACFGSPRPRVDLKHPDVTVHVDVRDDRAWVCVDTTGESLHARGYRVTEHAAPLNPCLASALVRLSGWERGLLLDPMCGSGTIPIEADFRARRRAPNLARASFAFQRLRAYDANAFERARDALACAAEDDAPPIMGNERDATRAAGARANARAAGARAEVMTGDFARLERPDGLDTVIVNPPWGIRMTSRRVSERIWADLARKLAEWRPRRAVVLMGNRAFEKRWPPQDARDVHYGGVPCRVLSYAF